MLFIVFNQFLFIITREKGITCALLPYTITDNNVLKFSHVSIEISTHLSALQRRPRYLFEMAELIRIECRWNDKCINWLRFDREKVFNRLKIFEFWCQCIHRVQFVMLRLMRIFHDERLLRANRQFFREGAGRDFEGLLLVSTKKNEPKWIMVIRPKKNLGYATGVHAFFKTVLPCVWQNSDRTKMISWCECSSVRAIDTPANRGDFWTITFRSGLRKINGDNKSSKRELGLRVWRTDVVFAALLKRARFVFFRVHLRGFRWPYTRAASVSFHVRVRFPAVRDLWSCSPNVYYVVVFIDVSCTRRRPPSGRTLGCNFATCSLLFPPPPTTKGLVAGFYEVETRV